MKKYVTCRVVDTVPSTAIEKERPAATCKLARVMHASSRQNRKPNPFANGPCASVLKSLMNRTYANHPFPAGESLNIAI